MFNAASFGGQALREASKQMLARDPGLLEKCLIALELVGRLQASGLPLIFKGGTSLLLHVQPIRRLSIDADIATEVPAEQVEEQLNRVVTGQPPFVGWERQLHRDRESPPTRHYKITYRSEIQQRDWTILLDVLAEAPTYPEIVGIVPTLDFARVDEPVAIRVPSVAGLLGDKLAAFAPTTIGILYEPKTRGGDEGGEQRPIRICKQLFDVATLFDVVDNLESVATRYQTVLAEQNRYREATYSMADTLNDSLTTAYWIAQTLRKGAETNKQTTFLQAGLKALDSHLLGTKLSPPDQIALSGKAAYLAAQIMAGPPWPDMAELRARMREVERIRALPPITGRFKILESARKISVEGYALWHEVHRLIPG